MRSNAQIAMERNNRKQEAEHGADEQSGILGNAFGTSRRKFLAASAAAGAGGIAFTGTGWADEHGGDGSGGMNESDGNQSEGDGMGDEGTGDGPTDLDILNYALTLERLENAFYRDAILSRETTVTKSEYLSELPMEKRQEVYDKIIVVGEHEQAHVDALVETIKSLGGDPVPELEYEFGVPRGQEADPDKFLEVAATLENTGVSAYAGAGPLIKDAGLVSAALSIHSVEARHAAYLNELTGVSPFPNAFDPALSMDEVLQAVEPFIVE